MSSGESYQDGRRKGFKEGYEQGKFDARMDLMVQWKREAYDNMGTEQLIQLLVAKDDYIEELKKAPTQDELMDRLELMTIKAAEYYEELLELKEVISLFNKFNRGAVSKKGLNEEEYSRFKELSKKYNMYLYGVCKGRRS